MGKSYSKRRNDKQTEQDVVAGVKDLILQTMCDKASVLCENWSALPVHMEVIDNEVVIRVGKRRFTIEISLKEFK